MATSFARRARREKAPHLNNRASTPGRRRVVVEKQVRPLPTKGQLLDNTGKVQWLKDIADGKLKEHTLI